jgi:hypothetical protein
VTRGLCSAILAFEAVTLLMGMFVIGWPAGAMAGACVVAVGLLGRPWGYGVGHALQVATVGLGAVSLSLLFIGLVFAALWVTAYVVGLRIDLARTREVPPSRTIR